MGSSTLARALSRGRRLNDWKTNPILRLRSRASSTSSSSSTGSSSRRYRPAVGRSSVPMTFSVVDLPDPEAPMMATISPRESSRETPRSACTSTSPIQ
ncbi:hypothetical protein BE20_12435 [Sorangium cellulosum]|nr:hypothetical protein BE20_12435 [Sorangium cellulosum]